MRRIMLKRGFFTIRRRENDEPFNPSIRGEYGLSFIIEEDEGETQEC
jgi:hypothetical protein